MHSCDSTGAVGATPAESPHLIRARALSLFSLVGLIVAVIAVILPAIPASAKGVAVSSASSAYVAVTPTRVLDTRSSGGPLTAGGTRDLVVAGGTTGVPAGATAVVINTTVTDTTAASYLTVYPTGGSVPFASNLNWVSGQTVANLVTVQVGTGGSITFFNKFGSTDVVVDLQGYFIAPSGTAGGEVALTPARITDTRSGSALGANASMNVQVTGKGGVPAAGVSAVILNATVTNTTAASYLTVWPAGATQPTASNLNWPASPTTRPNRVIVPVGTGGQISVFNRFGSTDVILDVNGYFTDATASGNFFTPTVPVRLADHQAVGANSSFNLAIAGVSGVPVGAKAAVLNVTVSETTAASYLTAWPTGVTMPLASDLNWVAGQVNPNLTPVSLGTGGQASFYNLAGTVNVSVDLDGYFGGQAPNTVTVSETPSSVAAD